MNEEPDYTRNNLSLFTSFRRALDAEDYESCARYRRIVLNRLKTGVLSENEVRFWLTNQNGVFDDSALNNVFTSPKP